MYHIVYYMKINLSFHTDVYQCDVKNTWTGVYAPIIDQGQNTVNIDQGSRPTCIYASPILAYDSSIPTSQES